MSFQKTAKENDSFYYKIGGAETTKIWKRPNFDTVKLFFLYPIVINILNNYSVSIIGNFLWKNQKTWDLDLNIINKKKLTLDVVEEHINQLNDISLNKFNLLLDISVRNKEHVLPKKTDLLKDENYVIEKDYYVKISYRKKIINDDISVQDVDGEKIKNTEYLIKVKSRCPLKNKIKNKILNSKKDNLIDYLKLEDFLKIDEEDFEKIKNY